MICNCISICRQRVEIPQEKWLNKKLANKKKKREEVPQEKWFGGKLPDAPRGDGEPPVDVRVVRVGRV